jgi:hypothetical protein
MFISSGERLLLKPSSGEERALGLLNHHILILLQFWVGGVSVEIHFWGDFVSVPVVTTSFNHYSGGQFYC